MDHQEEIARNDWTFMAEYLAKLKSFIRLYFVVFGILLVLGMLLYSITKPVYTATAVIGPPNPSPMNTLQTSLTGSTSTAGITRRLLGGAGSTANDPFQEYLQLLRSTRLVQEMVDKDHILPVIYAKNWDAEKHDWKRPGWLHNAVASVKVLLHRPVKDHPDVYDLQKYFATNFSVADASARRSSILSASASSYSIVSFSYPDRDMAVKILALTLKRADDIIREEQLRDVLARTSYLQTELPSVTRTEQREALIATLAGQEELKMMIMADHRYASIVVDTPNASPVPTSPMTPTRFVLFLIALSGFVWIGLVGLESRVPFVHRLIHRFKSKSAAMRERKSSERTVLAEENSI